LYHENFIAPDQDYYYNPDDFPPLPVIPGQQRRNFHRPDNGGEYRGHGPGNLSGYVCAICSISLLSFEELQIHLLTTHYDDPNARSMLDL